MAQPTKNVPELESDESWSKARQYAALIGPIPSTLADALRILWKEYQANPKGKQVSTPSDEAVRAIRMIERAPKLRAPIYFAASALYPDRFDGYAEDDVCRALLYILGPGMFAVLLGVVYFHRRVTKIVTSEDWQKLTKDLLINMELGFLVGQSSPRLGEAEGLLIGSIRHLALATMLIVKPADFAKYRRTTSKKFDPVLETNFFGCDHAQIAAYLINMLGFRKDVLEMGSAIRKIGKTTLPLSDALQIWKASLFFLDHLKMGICPPPDQSCSERLELTSPAICESLLNRCNQILDRGSSFGWLLRKSSEEQQSE